MRFDSLLPPVVMKCEVMSAVSVLPRRARKIKNIPCTHRLEARIKRIPADLAPVALRITQQGDIVEYRAYEGHLWRCCYGVSSLERLVVLSERNLPEVLRGHLAVYGTKMCFSPEAIPFEPGFGDRVEDDGYATAQVSLHDFCKKLLLIGDTLYIDTPPPWWRVSFTPAPSAKTSTLLSWVDNRVSQWQRDRSYSVAHGVLNKEAHDRCLSYHVKRHGSPIEERGGIELLEPFEPVYADEPDVTRCLEDVMTSFGKSPGLHVNLGDLAFEAWLSTRRAMETHAVQEMLESFTKLCLAPDLKGDWVTRAGHAALCVQAYIGTLPDCDEELREISRALDVFEWIRT